MTAVQPGWYPDPQSPATLRWYDGTAWTDHRAPAPAVAPPAWSAQPAGYVPTPAPWPPAPVPRGSNKAAIIVVSVVGGFFALSILAAIAIPVFLNQRALAELSALSSVSCESIGDEAVAYSQAEVTSGQIPLSSVSGLTVSQDNRASVSRPAPGDQAFVMSCAGTALWEDGVSTPVVVELSIDSAVEHVVTFTWEG